MSWDWLVYLREYRCPRHSLFTNNDCRFIEGNLVIICGCLPYLRQFFRRHAPRLIGDGSDPSSFGTRYQAKGVIFRRLRVRTITPDRLEQSQQTNPKSREEPDYSV